MTWQTTQSERYLKLIKSRLEHESLDWVEQVLDIVEQTPSSDAFSTIKDVGCQAAQFYKQLLSRSSRYSYFGYDIEQLYLDLALNKFPELNRRLFAEDFGSVTKPVVTDISVCGATLQHVDEWKPFLENLIESTQNLVILRTFMSDVSARELVMSDGAISPYPIWEFGFAEIMTFFAHRGWTPRVVRDRYTDSLPIGKWYGTSLSASIRSCFILVATPGISSS